MLDFQRGILALIKSAMDHTKAELPENFDWQKAIAYGKRHQILGLLYCGCKNSQIEAPLEIASFLKMALLKSAAVEQRQNYYIEKMFSLFRQNNIDFMPLKGVILRKYYPESGTRTMGDCDVLINMSQYQKTREIMQELGFEEKVETDHELVWELPNQLKVELHKRVVSKVNEDFYRYFGDGWRLAKEKVNDSSQYQMKNEDALIYNFAHMAKHYRNGGIGIRHILDIYVIMNKQPNLDFAYIDGELKKLKLFDFFYNVLHTIDVWFNGKETDEMSDWITDYIFSSGSFGTAKNHSISNVVKEMKTAKSAKFLRLKRLIDIVFLPYTGMCVKYPVVKKVPVLLPIMWVVRWVEIALKGKRHIAARADVSIKSLSANNIETFQDSLHYVGLDFNLEEKT